MRETTKRQHEILNFISDYISEHSYPPVIRDIAKYFNISLPGAYEHIIALKKKGLLNSEEKKSRTLELAGDYQELYFTEIPVLGTVAAGKPILCEENRDGSIKFPHDMLKKNAVYFALKVIGDSMTGAGIMEGDIAIIESRSNVRNGEIAVVLLEDSVTIKTFYMENQRIRLQPENSKHSPIYCNRDLHVLGRLAHIIRSYDSRLK